MVRVLFVCLGNICRSPMVEGIFKDSINKLGIGDKVVVESRGISKIDEGKPIHPKTLEILSSLEIDSSHKKSQTIKEIDFINFDYIIGMDKKNMKFLQNYDDGHFNNKIYMFDKKEVKDPFLTNQFDKTFKHITRHVDKWIEIFLNENETKLK